ncbi:C39 family peptidase [Pseudoneobacillus sp. C159]
MFKSFSRLTVLVAFIFLLYTDQGYAKTVDAPHIKQLPELARGCEVTSLAMMLQHAGMNVGKMQLAKEINKIPFKSNGLHGNPFDGFVGNIYTFSESGLGVYHGPIQKLAEKYVPGRTVNLTGTSFSNIYRMLDKGMPVWVITNSWFKELPASQFRTWQTKKGPLNITYREHSVLVTGYDAKYIYFHDPLYHKGNRAITKSDFIAAWNQMGKQAISYYPKNADWSIDTIDHWAKDEIAFLKRKGLISNNPQGKFAPNEPITRAEAAVLIDRALNIKVKPFKRLTFTDVKTSNPAYVSVAKVVQLGYIDGAPNFLPQQPLKRNEMAQLFSQAFHLQTPIHPIVYNDVKVNSKYYHSIQSLAATRVISTNGSFQPQGQVTKAQFASILAKLLKES